MKRPELSLHRAVAETLDRFAAPGVIWFHANANADSAKRGAQLKAMGVKAGVPDFVILSPTRKNPTAFLELKAPKGVLSDAQTEFAMAVRCMGCRYEIARSIDEAVDYLTAFGALEPGRVSVRAA